MNLIRIRGERDCTGVTVAGTAELAGILAVKLVDYVPSIGDQYEVISNARSVIGRFDYLDVPTLPVGHYWRLVYDDAQQGVDWDGDGRGDVTLMVVSESQEPLPLTPARLETYRQLAQREMASAASLRQSTLEVRELAETRRAQATQLQQQAEAQQLPTVRRQFLQQAQNKLDQAERHEREAIEFEESAADSVARAQRLNATLQEAAEAPESAEVEQ